MPDLEKVLLELEDALDADDLRAAGDACSTAGQIFLERNLYQDASQYYHEASDHYGTLGENKLQAKALNHLGICQIMLKDAAGALENLEEAFALLSGSPDSTLQIAIQGNIGLAHSALNNHARAIQAHKMVLESAEEKGDDPLRLNALINLADSNLQNKNYISAQGFALVGLDLAKKIPSNPGLVILYDLLGMISSRQGNLKDAVGYHQQSCQVAQENGDLLRQGIALANKGLALEGLTDLEDALEAMSQAEELFTLLNSSYLEKTRRDLERVRKARA